MKDSTDVAPVCYSNMEGYSIYNFSLIISNSKISKYLVSQRKLSQKFLVFDMFSLFHLLSSQTSAISKSDSLYFELKNNESISNVQDSTSLIQWQLLKQTVEMKKFPCKEVLPRFGQIVSCHLL